MAHAGIRLHVDAIERAGRLEHFLRGAEVERGERDRPEVVAVAEAEEADDLELLGRAAQEHPHVVADREPVVSAVAASIATSSVASRWAAHAVVDEPERAAVGPRRAERRRPAAADALAVTRRRTARNP